MSIVRGCGRRKVGAIYAEVPLSPFGMPFEYFLLDPPVPVDAREMGLTAVGVKLIKRPDTDEDVYDVYDIIGADSYPNIADFIEEGRRFGLSRRISTAVDFSLLSDKSKMILLHPKAFILNPDDYHAGCTFDCPKEIADHNAIWSAARPEKLPGRTTIPACIGLWHQDIEGGEEMKKEGDAAWDRTVQRMMPSFTYFGHARPEGVTPQYALAIFGALTIGRLVVINDPDANTHEMSMQKASRSSLTVDLEDE
jgi:hypothetical protein